MVGKKIKEIADKSPYTSRELAELMNMSTSTLYSMYKKKYVKEEYLIRFSEITEIPVSELKGYSTNISEKEFEKLKQENEKLKQENIEIKEKNSFLSKKLNDLESKFNKLNESLAQKFLGLELGKAKASSKRATLPTHEELNLFSLNFGE